MTDLSSKRARDARAITIRGAREHNLKNVDVSIPRDQLVVFTGLSGSGKSSLAFDTIYAEGQRRYVESLSAYARQFLEMMQKPDVDQIDGLSPAISIEQKTTSKNPRSTVGTVTEIYDYMRLLWARIGVRRWSIACWRCRTARASTCWHRWCAAARANTRRNWPTSCARATSASRSTAPSTRSPRSSRSTRNSPTTSTSWSTAWW
jgi:excinuclease UvrABC ATPase subunit